jgi:hypothetical protein
LLKITKENEIHGYMNKKGNKFRGQHPGSKTETPPSNMYVFVQKPHDVMVCTLLVTGNTCQLSARDVLTLIFVGCGFETLM